MRSKIRNIAAVSVIATSLFGAIALHAHPGSSDDTMSGESMMGKAQGDMMGMMRMMAMMEQMSEMMQTCSEMMGGHREDGVRQHGEPVAPVPMQ